MGRHSASDKITENGTKYYTLCGFLGNLIILSKPILKLKGLQGNLVIKVRAELATGSFCDRFSKFILVF